MAGNNNHLHLLSRAAAYDAAAAVDGAPPTGMPLANLDTNMETHMNGTMNTAMDTQMLPPPPPMGTFDLTNPFADPLDFDFTAIVQDYMQLGWAGWQ